MTLCQFYLTALCAIVGGSGGWLGMSLILRGRPPRGPARTVDLTSIPTDQRRRRPWVN